MPGTRRRPRAEIEQIEAGLKNRTHALAKRGYDADQVDAEIAADKAHERSLGLSFAATLSSDHPAMPSSDDGGARCPALLSM